MPKTCVTPIRRTSSCRMVSGNVLFSANSSKRTCCQNWKSSLLRQMTLKMFSIMEPSVFTKLRRLIRSPVAQSIRRLALIIAAGLVIGALMLTLAIGNTGNIPAGDLPGWRQTGFQDFVLAAERGRVGEVYGSDMRGYSGFSDTTGRGTYSPDSVLSVADGKLHYFLHSESGNPRVASVIPFGYSGQVYGRYSIRFRSDSLPGYKIAFMLWPTSDEWRDGEIDWPEGQLNGPL